VVLKQTCDALIERGHKLTVLSQRVGAEGLRELPTAALRRSPFRMVFNSQVLEIRAAARSLRPWLEQADRIVVHNHPAQAWLVAAGYMVERAKVRWLCHEPPRRLHRAITDRHMVAVPEDGPDWQAALREVATQYRKRPRKRLVRSLEQRGAEACGLIAGNSKYSASLVKQVYGLDAEALPCGVEVPDAPGDWPREPGLLYVSPFNANKNVAMAVEVFCRLAPERPELTLTLIGRGKLEGWIKERLTNAALLDRVRFPGRVSLEELMGSYATARVVLYPSLDEPLGLVPLEAMVRGTPVVVANHGGPAETVLDGVTGLHADPLDVDDFAARTAELIDDPVKAEAFGRAGREHVIREYSLAGFLDKFVEFVERDLAAV
jgi:glycosyltransferase involved in cell wall biosynthesis